MFWKERQLLCEKNKEAVITTLPFIGDKEQPYADLLIRAHKKGTVSAIIGLRLPIEFKVEGELTSQAIEFQRATINLVRQELLGHLANYKVVVISGSDAWIIPSVALDIDENALRYLISSPLVADISENIIMDSLVLRPNFSGRTESQFEKISNRWRRFLYCVQ